MKSFALCSLACVYLAQGTHYEKPPCAADESVSQISGTSGYVCAPSCPKGKCPTDAPTGVTAKPECALSDPLGNKYCVLECASDKECDQAGGASCDLIQPPKGVCLYKKSANAENVKKVIYKKEEEAAFKSVLQVTCPKSCTNCQCKGCKNITVPLGKCTPAGQGAAVIGSCSGNGKTFTEEIYLNAKCQGQAATRSDINTDACIETSETHQHCAYFCEKTAAPEDPEALIVYKKSANAENVKKVIYKKEEAAFKSVLQVTCPKSCTNCQCKGCKNITVPLGKCTPAGQGAGVIGSCNGKGTTFTEEIYLNAKCQGQAATRSDINTDACIQTSETHQYCAYFCEKTAAPEDLIV